MWAFGRYLDFWIVCTQRVGILIENIETRAKTNMRIKCILLNKGLVKNNTYKKKKLTHVLKSPIKTPNTHYKNIQAITETSNKIMRSNQTRNRTTDQSWTFNEAFIGARASGSTKASTALISPTRRGDSRGDDAFIKTLWFIPSLSPYGRLTSLSTTLSALAHPRTINYF